MTIVTERGWHGPTGAALAAVVLAMTLGLLAAPAQIEAQPQRGVPDRHCILPYQDWQELYREARAQAQAHVSNRSSAMNSMAGLQPVGCMDYLTAMGANGFETGDAIQRWNDSQQGATLPDLRTVTEQIRVLQDTWERCYRPRPIRVLVRANVTHNWLRARHEAEFVLEPQGRHSPDIWVGPTMRRRGIEVQYEGSTTVAPEITLSENIPPEVHEELRIETRDVSYELGATVTYRPIAPSFINFWLTVEGEPQDVMRVWSRSQQRYVTDWQHGDLASAGWVGTFNMQRIESEDWERRRGTQHGFFAWDYARYEGSRQLPGAGSAQVIIEMQK